MYSFLGWKAGAHSGLYHDKKVQIIHTYSFLHFRYLNKNRTDNALLYYIYDVFHKILIPFIELNILSSLGIVVPDNIRMLFTTYFNGPKKFRTKKKAQH